VEGGRTDFDEHWQKLLSLGCQFEVTKIKVRPGERILFAVDVPPEVDVHVAYHILEQAEQAGVWIFQEGHLGHPLKT
jgi:hypothetical protein